MLILCYIGLRDSHEPRGLRGDFYIRQFDLTPFVIDLVRLPQFAFGGANSAPAHNYVIYHWFTWAGLSLCTLLYY